MRPLSDRYGLRLRLMIMSLVLVLLATLAIGAAVTWNYSRLAKNDLLTRVGIETEIIIQNVSVSILFDDRATAQEIISTFSADPSVLSAELYNKEGELFSQYQADVESLKTASFEFKREIIFQEEIIGYMLVEVSNQEIRQQNFAILVFLVTVSLIVLVVAFSFSHPLINSTIQPLLKLHDTSQRIAETGDYSLRSPVTSSDEVGRLSLAFNQMLNQIEHRDDMLEKQVRQRTTELEKLAEEFRYRAFHDNLTGLPNRALMDERFEHSVEHTLRCDNRFACLLLDLDDFKTINDTKGHEFGDDLLIEVAKRLKATVRAEDLVCRIGGDEFLILLNDLKSPDDVNTIARKILTRLGREFVLKSERFKTGVSIGGALFPDHGTSASEIKRHADVAMYRAKAAGKNQFCIFTEGMQDDVKYRLLIKNDLKPAIARGDFEIYVQPKINAVDNQIVGCEALVRWNHPQEGFLTPDKFIPFAEEAGLISDIDYFVIRESCRKQKEWTTLFNFPIPIAFNLSGRHFHDFKIVEVLQNAIDEFAIDPSLLEAEITEAVLIEDPEKAQKIVHAVKALGICISLDDFGTGYSSLNYLRTLPIDTVKLDRSFVSNIVESVQDRRLTRGIVSLAQGLNLRLIAEGVENEKQMNALMELGCFFMQGFYFLRPVKTSDFLQWHLKRYTKSILSRQRA